VVETQPALPTRAVLRPDVVADKDPVAESGSHQLVDLIETLDVARDVDPA
jgi:hypothetical protein